jgi:hypothetical protein
MLTLMRSSTPAANTVYHPRTPALAPELGRAYSAQRQHRTIEGETKLREITVALVRRLKSDGLSPERVIVAIKAAIVRYGDEHRAPSLADLEDGHAPGGETYERVFRCLLDTYFHAEI